MASSHPLVRLWRHATGHRRRIVLASAASVGNKLFDLAPPFLIGAAVDIVVRREGSLLAEIAGVTDLATQLYVLAGLTVLVWVLESPDTPTPPSANTGSSGSQATSNTTAASAHRTLLTCPHRPRGASRRQLAPGPTDDG